jgi:putative ABC transport system permease protein
MLQNYLKLAIRSLLKHKGYSAINILGLTAGVTCCLLIMLYVADEQGQDQSWPNAERIHRMSLERIYPDRKTGYAIVPPSYAQAVKNDCPEVETVVRIADIANGVTAIFKKGDQQFEEKHFLAVDSTFFKVFQIKVLKGNPDKCLNEPNSLVMTESTARRYFGNAEPIGQQIELLGGAKPQAFNVTAICADVPPNVHFEFDLLLPTFGIPFLEGTNFISFAANTYFLLHPEASSKALESKFPDLVEKYAAGEIQRNFGVSWPEYKASGNGYRYYLTPVTDIHLHSNLEAELKTPGSATMVRTFTLIALFILLLACINFMNLATARSAERAREVGIRKALGSERRQLAVQFLLESVLVSTVAVLLATGLVWILLPFFNNLADKQLNLAKYANITTVSTLFLMAIGVGLLAGSYPAGVLSGFRPIEVLKGKFSAQKKGVWLRNGLVTFQFAISIAMIISTLVVFSQMSFIANKKLGFQKEHIFVIQEAFVLQEKTEAFKQELLKISGVESVGGTTEMPGGRNWFGSSFKKPEDNEMVTGRGLIVDADFVQSMQMELLAGRAFSKDFNDSLSVILNERAVKDLGLGADPIGKRIVQPGSVLDPAGGNVTCTVVGIVKDFHFQSLHEPIVPLFIQNNRIFKGFNALMSVRVQPDQFESFIKKADQVWHSFVADQPFHYTLLDADLAALYIAEKRAQRIFALFAALTIFIACIGLFGLAAYLAQLRTKEIGVRKVLGASVLGLVGLLAKDFLKLVTIAIFVATPVAYLLMQKWLSNFAYRIDMQWWIFAIAGLSALLIAFLTVSYQSVKAALVNPVKSLRSE